MPHTKYGNWGRNMKYGGKKGGSDVILVFVVLAALVLCVALLRETARATGAANQRTVTRE